MMTRQSRALAIAGATLLSVGLGGCAAPFIAGLTLNELSSGTSIISTGLTGKGLIEHIADAITGKDCRVIEGLARDTRDVCEEPNSVATRSDFKGLIGMIEGDNRELDIAERPGKPPVPVLLADLTIPERAGKPSALVQIAAVTPPPPPIRREDRR